MSAKELAQVPFSADEEQFIRNLMQNEGSFPFGCGVMPRYSGWYPKLFYRPFTYTRPPLPWMSQYESDDAWFHENHGANAADLIIADVHTDPPAPDVGDPGSVLHQAVGRVGLMVIAVDNGADRMVYAGPVMTHYELEVLGPPRRLNDDEWSSIIHQGLPLPNVLIEGLQPPPWTTNYFVPR
jgi:hypothetical protein